VPPPSSAKGGSETILLVEDDAQVRTAVAIILRRSGYTVLESENAGEAMLVCEQMTTIDLLLTDVVLPRMTGRELATRLSPSRPRMKVLYMSGHVPESLLDDPAVAGSIIEKPVTAATLLGKVREVIDRAS
jgi:DNA-binding NtrC family response regulator